MTTTRTPMRGTYGGKAATFYFLGDEDRVTWTLLKDPGAGAMVGTNSVAVGDVEITEATPAEFARLADVWLRHSRYLTPTADGGNIRAFRSQASKYLNRAAGQGGGDVRRPDR